MGESVLYLVQRLLIGWGVVSVILWLSLWSGNVHAWGTHPSSPFDYSSQAQAACEASSSAYAASLSGYGPNCWHNPAAKNYVCGVVKTATGQTYSCSTNNANWHANHYYITLGEPPPPDCELPSGTQQSHAYHYTVGGAAYGGGNLCSDNCLFTENFGGDIQCSYSDSNSNGSADVGEPVTCSIPYVSTGGNCSAGGGQEPTMDTSAPNPNYFDCTNVDCGPNPAPGGGTGEQGTGTGVEPQDPPTPGTGGDGDSSTPNVGDGTGNNPGTGPGSAAGGYGDCNPQSNPDCSYAGSGTGSGVCDAQPSCTGDPVQCAILYQEWASMCYDGGEFTNPADCRVPLECEGDVLLCEMIRQERKQYCDAYVGDGTNDLDVTDDVGFDRDLKDEAEVYEVMDIIDTEGFAGAGSCPAPQAVGVLGGSVNISYQPMCDLAAILRPLLILAALLIGYMIIGGKK